MCLQMVDGRDPARLSSPLEEIPQWSQGPERELISSCLPVVSGARGVE